MKLKAFYQTADEIPSGQADFYEERDGAWHLSVEGMVPRAKLEEFRTNNIELTRERDDLKKKYEGVDADEYRELKGRADDIRNEKLLKKGEVDQLIEQRTGEMKRQHEAEIAKARKEAEEANSKLSTVMIDQALVAAGTKFHVRTEALEDLQYRGRTVFRLENGEPVAYGQDGKPMYDANADPIKIEQWVESLAKKAPHLFQESSGTGGGNQNGGPQSGIPGGTNPWKKETWNLTQQGMLIRKDPNAARRMKAAAGVA